jgi:hypothetical protein
MTRKAAMIGPVFNQQLKAIIPSLPPPHAGCRRRDPGPPAVLQSPLNKLDRPLVVERAFFAANG